MNEAMNKVRDYIALIMTLGMLIFVGFKVPIPDRLWDVYLAIVMFFFGSKSNDTVIKPATILANQKVD